MLVVFVRVVFELAENKATVLGYMLALGRLSLAVQLILNFWAWAAPSRGTQLPVESDCNANEKRTMAMRWNNEAESGQYTESECFF